MTTENTDCQRRPFTKAERAAVIAKADGVCGICGCPLMEPGKFVVDHITPLGAGGCNELSNLQAAHRRCNGMKSKRAAPDWESSETGPGSSTGSEVYDLAFDARAYTAAMLGNGGNPFVLASEAPDKGRYIRSMGAELAARLLFHGACLTGHTGDILPTGREAYYYIWPHVAARSSRYNKRLYSLICPAKTDLAAFTNDRRKGEDETRRRVMQAAELWLRGEPCRWPCREADITKR